MLSLENALNADEFASWYNLWTQMFGPDVEVIGEFKYDGVAISVLYIDGMFIRALTRGDGEYGEDITRHVSLFVPNEIPVTGVVEVRGEAIVRNTHLDVINLGKEKYANARSAAVGLLNPSRKEVSHHTNGMTFIPYELEGPDFIFNCYTDKLEILKDLGYTMLSCFIITAGKIQEVFETIAEVRKRGDIPYEIDGMVFKINDIDKQMKLGETNHAPRHQFAYKFPPITGECRLLNVVFQVGRTGEIAPVAKITATALMGVVVTSVLLHNEDRMRERGIAIGNTYEVYRSGDVIPHMGKLIKTCGHPQEVNFPHECPSCGSPVVKHGAFYYCEYKHHCPAK
jgi:DNA ligase (NAD+)